MNAPLANAASRLLIFSTTFPRGWTFLHLRVICTNRRTRLRNGGQGTASSRPASNPAGISCGSGVKLTTG